jgi:hypothetical protein
MLKNTLWLVFIIVTVSCSKKKEVKHLSLDFRILQSIEIPMMKKNQYSHSQIQLIDSCTFVGLDRDFQKLDIYSKCEKRLLRSINFEGEGPNRIYPTSSFHYISNDSIFLYSSDASTFQLIDSDAQVLNEWRVFDNKYPNSISDSIIGGNGSYYPFSYTQNGIFYFPFLHDDKEGDLIVQIHPESNLSGFGDMKTQYSAPILASLNLAKRDFEQFQGSWPDNFLKEKAPYNPFIHLSLNHDGSNVLISYFNSDLIFSTKEDKFFEIPSKFFDNNYTLFSITESADYTTEEELDAYHNDEGYVNLVYDTYKKLYYRIAKHANKKSGDESTHRMESEWSIIVFNEQFEIVGEVLMPRKKYNYLQILPTSKGLLISKENPYSPSNKEEVYEFDLIEIDL